MTRDGRARRALPLRVRLVAGFTVAMLVLLIAAGGFVYWRVQYALDRGLDTELAAASKVLTPLVAADGTVRDDVTADATGTGWQVLDARGRVLDSGGPTRGRALLPPERLGNVGDGVRTVDVGRLLPVSTSPYRLRVSKLREGAGVAAYLVVGVPRGDRDEALRELLLQLAVAGAGALVVASLVGDQLARLALRPVERYRRRAAEIAAGADRLRLEVPDARDDEVTRLGHTLNQMLAALEESLDRERRFVHDASHELRTPLTLLTSRVQLARRRRRTVEEHERVLEELAVDVARLVDLADQLLELRPPASGEVPAGDLAQVAVAVVRRWRTAHPGREDDVVLTTSPGPVRVPLELPVLDRVVGNLLTNALTHGHPPVRLDLSTETGLATLAVVDRGPGMTADLLVRASQRFARAPEARSRPGAGLGLSIVEHLVLSAGGGLRLCHAGEHAHSGLAEPDGPFCRAGDAMTVAVLLPLVDG